MTNRADLEDSSSVKEGSPKGKKKKKDGGKRRHEDSCDRSARFPIAVREAERSRQGVGVFQGVEPRDLRGIDGGDEGGGGVTV